METINYGLDNNILSRCCHCNHMKEFIIKVIKEYCKFCDENELKEFIIKVIKEYCKFCDEETLKEFIIEIIKEICPLCDEEALKEFIVKIIKETCPLCDEEELKKFIIEIIKEYDSSKIKGLHMQLRNKPTERITSPIRFDTPMFDNSDGAITYEDGSFALREQGTYKIDWELSYENLASSSDPASIMFYANNGGYALSSSQGQVGQLSGTVLINTFVLPLYCGLKDESRPDINFQNTPVQANIVITKIG